jgi:hypothetical protein
MNQFTRWKKFRHASCVGRHAGLAARAERCNVKAQSARGGLGLRYSSGWITAPCAVVDGLPREVGAKVEVEEGRDLLEEGDVEFAAAVVEDFHHFVAVGRHCGYLLIAFALYLMFES